MTNFTPGPWGWVWVKPEYWGGEWKREGLLGTNGSYVMSFGADYAYYNRCGDVPCEANANLIAAAPDLYKALDDLLDAVGFGKNLSDAIDAGVDALIKARGES